MRCPSLNFSSDALTQIQSTSLVLSIYQVWCFCGQHHEGEGPPKFIENSRFFIEPIVFDFETHMDRLIAIVNRFFLPGGASCDIVNLIFLSEWPWCCYKKTLYSFLGEHSMVHPVKHCLYKDTKAGPDEKNYETQKICLRAVDLG